MFSSISKLPRRSFRFIIRSHQKCWQKIQSEWEMYANHINHLHSKFNLNVLALYFLQPLFVILLYFHWQAVHITILQNTHLYMPMDPTWPICLELIEKVPSYSLMLPPLKHICWHLTLTFFIEHDELRTVPCKIIRLMSFILRGAYNISYYIL